MPAEGIRSRARGAGLWLLYLVWFYPCWWLAQVAIVASPELLRAAVGGSAVRRLSISPMGVSARSVETIEQAAWTLAAAAVLWGVWLGIGRLAPALDPAARLGRAWAAYAVMARGVVSVFFNPDAWVPGALLAFAGFAGLALSLGRLPLPAWAGSSMRRAAALFAVVLGPLAASLTLPFLLQGELRMFPPFPAVLVGAGAAIFVACRLPAVPPVRAAFAPAIVCGAVLGLATFFGARWAEGVLAQRVEAARQASIAPVPDRAPLPPVEPGFYYKGVNFTSEWPEPYGTKSAARILSELPSYGVNAVALVPYASQRPEDPELAFPLRMERDELIFATAKMAHAEGLRVLLKPQIWVRGEGLYPGDLRYDDAPARARWFDSYARFIEHYAKLATRIDADVFCVGVELVQLTPYESDWRRIIAIARRHYAGKLVYAANFGIEFESVELWDALDYIGLDNYYPLPEDRSVTDIASRIEAVHRKFGKPILFTEAGFSTYELSHRAPWEDRPGGRLSPEAQARNVEALLRGFQRHGWLQGIFWWKVGTSPGGGPDDGSHILWNKPAMDVIGKWFNLPGNSSVHSE